MKKTQMRAIQILAALSCLVTLVPAKAAPSVAEQCLHDAATAHQVSEPLLRAMDKAEFGMAPATCQRYSDGAELLAAAIKDASGDQQKALTLIHKGPVGPHMRNAYIAITARAQR